MDLWDLFSSEKKAKRQGRKKADDANEVDRHRDDMLDFLMMNELLNGDIRIKSNRARKTDK